MNAAQFQIGQIFQLEDTLGYFEVNYKSETSTDFGCTKYTTKGQPCDETIYFEFNPKGIRMWTCAAGTIFWSKKTYNKHQITFHENKPEIQNAHREG